MGIRVSAARTTRVNPGARATPSPLRHYSPSKSEIFGMIGSPPGGFAPRDLDKFTADKVGQGMTTVSLSVHRDPRGNTSRVVHFLIYGDQFDAKAPVKSATLVVMKPGGSAPIEIPMSMAKDAARGWNRMAVKVNVDDLNTMRGSGSELEFVYKLKVAGQKDPVWVNQNGEAFRNFKLPKEQMGARY